MKILYKIMKAWRHPVLLLGHVLICVLVCVSFPRSGVKHINILVFGCNLSLEFVLVLYFPSQIRI